MMLMPLSVQSVTLMFAGSETVANTLNVGTFHVLHDERILAMLFQELQHQWPEGDSRMSYDKLEKLPYLVGYSTVNLISEF